MGCIFPILAQLIIMGTAKTIFRFFFSLYGFIVFLAIMLLLFPAVIISSFFTEFRAGRAIYAICRLWADLAFFCWGIRHTNIYDSPHDRSRPMVFVFNHISYMDIPMLMKAFRGQDLRVLGKADMASVPVFGFIYRKAAILVDRADPAARVQSVENMKRYLNKNISVALAPEGTFNYTGKPLKDFYNGAFRIAIETQTPIKPVLLLDGNARLNNRSIFTLNPGRSRAVFLEEIPVAGLELKDLEMLKEKVYGIMEQALIRYKADWIQYEH